MDGNDPSGSTLLSTLEAPCAGSASLSLEICLLYGTKTATGRAGHPAKVKKLGVVHRVVHDHPGVLPGGLEPLQMQAETELRPRFPGRPLRGGPSSQLQCRTNFEAGTLNKKRPTSKPDPTCTRNTPFLYTDGDFQPPASSSIFSSSSQISDRQTEHRQTMRSKQFVSSEWLD
jgi:hypothetical protein